MAASSRLIAPVRSVARVAGQVFDDQFQPVHHADRCQHMSGVCSQLAVRTQHAQLLAARQQPVQYQQGMVLCQEPLAKLSQHAGVETGVIQLQ